MNVYVDSILFKSLSYFSVIQTWRDDGRCGGNFLLPNGDVAECDPMFASCCSEFGWCGSSVQHCTCEKCVDYEKGARIL